MRYTIADKLDDKRKESKLVMSARQTKMNLATNLRNLDPQSTGYVSREQMVWAMGNDFMKLKMTKDEARKAIEDIAATNKHVSHMFLDSLVILIRLLIQRTLRKSTISASSVHFASPNLPMTSISFLTSVNAKFIL